MNSEIYRYALDARGFMFKSDYGPYVHFEVLAAAVAAKDAEIADANYWRKRHCEEAAMWGKQSNDHWMEIQQLQSKLTAAEAEIERLKGLITTGVGT